MITNSQIVIKIVNALTIKTKQLLATAIKHQNNLLLIFFGFFRQAAPLVNATNSNPFFFNTIVNERERFQISNHRLRMLQQSTSQQKQSTTIESVIACTTKKKKKKLHLSLQMNPIAQFPYRNHSIIESNLNFEKKILKMKMI
jgi:hypothetical protein